MKKNKKILIISLTAAAIALITAAIVMLFNIFTAYNCKGFDTDMLASLSLEKKNKLMIVAHPDDETIWGGANLLDGDYLVICLTNGNNKTRKNEFYAVMEYCGCSAVILDYPDKVNNIRDNWSHTRERMIADLAAVISYKQWDMIVTHNPEGEYGHKHHKLTSSFVTDICAEKKLSEKLIYFGKYYTESELAEARELTCIDDSKKDGLEHMLSLYASQKHTVQKLRHMVYYEMWENAVVSGNTEGK